MARQAFYNDLRPAPPVHVVASNNDGVGTRTGPPSRS